MEQYAALLRNMASYIGLDSVRALANQADIKDVYRVSVQHDAMRSANSVTTLLRTSNSIRVESCYVGFNQNKPLIRTVSYDEFHDFVIALRKIPFDGLPDQPNLTFHGEDIWLIERASAGFSKSLLIEPEIADNRYRLLYDIVTKFLPETVRVI